MEAYVCETKSWVSAIQENPDEQTNQLGRTSSFSSEFIHNIDEYEWPKLNSLKSKKKKKQVLLEGSLEAADDDNLDELKGCLDLGFWFSYEEIPELCNTLPALKLCYSISQKFMDEHQKSPESSLAAVDSVSGPIANCL